MIDVSHALLSEAPAMTKNDLSRELETGSVLLVVLVTLALLAAMAGLVIRVSEVGSSTLAAERSAFQREVLIQSAIAVLGARLPSSDLREDGTPTSIVIPGGVVVVRIFAAPGLINPNFTTPAVLAASLAALGASPEQTKRLTMAMVSARVATNRMAFRDLNHLALLFKHDPELWLKLVPYITLLGKAETVDIATAPRALRNVASPSGAILVDFSGAKMAAGRNFYEIWLHVKDPVLDATDPSGRLWIHVSALVGADHRIHIVGFGWPEAIKEDT